MSKNALKLDTQDALAGLRRWSLVRDDSGPHRVYRDENGHSYASVTHILKETSPQWQKDALDRWLERPSAPAERDIACQRGTLAHDHAEYVLKTAAKLARNSANKRGSWRTGDDGLERAPKGITTWAIEKAIQGAPRVPWSASGYARGLRTWIGEKVTAIHAITTRGNDVAIVTPEIDAFILCDIHRILKNLILRWTKEEVTPP